MIVPTLATEKLTDPRVDVDAWENPGLPHIRLDFTVVDEEPLHCSSAMRKGQEEALTAAQAERVKTNKNRKAKGGVGVIGISTAHRTIWLRVGHAPSQACGVQTSNQQSSRQRRRTTTARVAKTSERSAGEVHRHDSPLGHRAQGLERNVVRTGPVSFTRTVGDRTTPCEHRVKDTHRHTHRHTDTQTVVTAQASTASGQTCGPGNAPSQNPLRPTPLPRTPSPDPLLPPSPPPPDPPPSAGPRQQ